MEQIPKQEKPISPEDFFANKIDLRCVSKEEFIQLVRENTFFIDEKKILSINGIGFPYEGKTLILIRKDVFPEKYMPYLETHEKWEAYMSRKEGYNLSDKSNREYKNEIGSSFFNKNNMAYNFDFSHEYAIFKEYEEAMKDGKLDEYYKWFLNLREKQKITANEEFLKLIENDTKIRESIYKKLKEGTKHSFQRN